VQSLAVRRIRFYLPSGFTPHHGTLDDMWEYTGTQNYFGSSATSGRTQSRGHARQSGSPHRRCNVDSTEHRGSLPVRRRSGASFFLMISGNITLVPRRGQMWAAVPIKWACMAFRILPLQAIFPARGGEQPAGLMPLAMFGSWVGMDTIQRVPLAYSMICGSTTRRRDSGLGSAAQDFGHLVSTEQNGALGTNVPVRVRPPCAGSTPQEISGSLVDSPMIPWVIQRL